MQLADAAGSFLAFLARLITGAQGHWHGCPPKAEQRIYLANHQSHFDWVLLWAALPRDLRATTRPIAALLMACVAGGRGTLGEFVMKALKRDAGVRNWGCQACVAGALGLLDRIAPICFAAPVFFHAVRWHFHL